MIELFVGVGISFKPAILDKSVVISVCCTPASQVEGVQVEDSETRSNACAQAKLSHPKKWIRQSASSGEIGEAADTCELRRYARLPILPLRATKLSFVYSMYRGHC